MTRTDPTTRTYPAVAPTGWTVQTPDEMFAVLAELMGHLGRLNDGTGQQLLARLWRVNNPLLMRIAALDQPTHTCAGKGGAYQYLGVARPAGVLKDVVHPVQVYRDVETGELYFRTPADFTYRMVELEQP